MSNSEKHELVPPRASLQSTLWSEIVASRDPGRRRLLAGTSAALVALIGLVDYLTGFEISLLPFYFLPICLATAAVGWTFGVVVATASVASWIFADFAAGARFGNPLVVGWNALIALSVYLVVVWLLSSLLAANRRMEERVRQRTAALSLEIAERERLERAVLEIGERERRAVGRDLHDGLGQHLTGTALVAQALSGRLAGRGDPEAAEARKIVTLVEQGIEQTRSLARGLLLAEIEREGLSEALRQLAAATSAQSRVDCTFRDEGAAALGDGGTATHLYRIAQEAVRNAVRHGKAAHIEISLVERDDGVLLSIRDDGVGFAGSGDKPAGLGLQIMDHRADIIGAAFDVAARPGGGTLVTCRLARPSSSS